MVIDIHTHAFPEKIAASALRKLSVKSHTRPFTDGTPRGLAASMEKAGVTYSVLQPVATRPDQVTHVNDAALRGYQEKGLLSFGCMHPDFEGWHAELERIAPLRGIKLHPVYQGVPIDDPRFLRILERAGELGLVVLIHAGWDVGFPSPDADQALPRRLLNAARQAGNLILAHMGGWRCWDEAAELLSGRENVFIDTAFSLGRLTPLDDGYYKEPEELEMLSQEAFVRLVRTWGADHVLFGTDSPWADQAESLKAIQELPLTEAERSAILSGNALRLLNKRLP